ncbi:MAG: hypothetical protein AB8B52_03455 [Winogradskyella sp.]|uniref:hypothetical protein n=1 Tax=Winogradskyella sp. TaxID=1883156 RepID=UPI00385BE0E1
MKKLALILFALTLVTACNIEPLDPDLVDPQGGNNNGGNSGSESDDLTLELYQLDTNISFSFFGTPIETVTKSDLIIVNNKIDSGINKVSVSGSPFVEENQVITRNTSGQIISDISVNQAGVTTNEYIITYTNGVISNITYEYTEDEDDNFNYNFTYDANTITREEVGSTITTVFTVDASDRIISKASFDDGVPIQTETITYDNNGNITGSVAVLEIQSNNTYVYDNQLNPLKVVYEDNYLLNFLRDDYSDEIGPQIAQFLSTNNWRAGTFNGQSFTFNLEYNTVGRITNRTIAYGFDSGISFQIDELFDYVN